MAGTTAFALWTEILDLPVFVVVRHEDDVAHGRHFFTVAPQHEIGICPHCGKPGETVKQRRNRERIVDLPMGCRSVDFLAEGAHATERLLRRAADLMRNSDVANAARFFGIPEKNLERWYYDFLERQQSHAAKVPPGPIRRIGIDELSLKSDTDSSSR
jgi:hypothetical protein